MVGVRDNSDSFLNIPMMHFKIAISLFLLPLCNGVPAESKGFDVGVALQSGQTPKVAPAMDTNKRNPPARIEHYRTQGTSMLGLMREDDAQKLDAYRNTFKVKDFAYPDHGE
ncbi:hypothetical protein CERZMDRAFT_97386 [Cercospora zeae-maydis SCOH1-5]|uniref:Uncharacterized protein n=1 Tax=Cercospora zeae-maydis SCOH1-5 TaxID=717836 RepID=A0A6A6FHR2_9PEZI|nr:hypothetical protein CERZMDRAFT_97386 [Cercospora zeae-maydis SCOH1-5]